MALYPSYYYHLGLNMTNNPSSSKDNATNSSLSKNLLRLQHKIIDYALAYQRRPEDISLIAVSKTQPADIIKQAYLNGQVKMAENYLQEALKKIEKLQDLPIEWHFIGSIQSNKTKAIAENFSWVQSVASEKIAKKLNDYRQKVAKPLNILLQVNIDDEQSKDGISPEKLIALADFVTTLPWLKLRGLMSIPKHCDQFDMQRKTFSKLKIWYETLKQKYPVIDTLSMGMSADFEAAIAEGSTMIRIGTAIFGARKDS